MRRIGVRPRDVLSVRSSAYKRLGLAERDISDDELLDLLAAEPTLLRRPLVVAGDRFALGYDAARITALAGEDASP
ncbi:MAG: hypothetical protein DCC58_01570 [Chloroflexi bacterium]|nr:MAG: hypothetical protein DCC58_01570 [Chloroflexota bacterium]